jgi:TatD DNase family protein
MCETLKLPLFLHCRNAASDLVNILFRNRDQFNGGVVHSFDGSEQDMKFLLELGYYIGINGWYVLLHVVHMTVIFGPITAMDKIQ